MWKKGLKRDINQRKKTKPYKPIQKVKEDIVILLSKEEGLSKSKILKSLKEKNPSEKMDISLALEQLLIEDTILEVYGGYNFGIYYLYYLNKDYPPVDEMNAKVFSKLEELDKPISMEELSRELHIPFFIIRDYIHELKELGSVVKSRGGYILKIKSKEKPKVKKEKTKQEEEELKKFNDALVYSKNLIESLSEDYFYRSNINKILYSNYDLKLSTKGIEKVLDKLVEEGFIFKSIEGQFPLYFKQTLANIDFTLLRSKILNRLEELPLLTNEDLLDLSQKLRVPYNIIKEIVIKKLSHDKIITWSVWGYYLTTQNICIIKHITTHNLNTGELITRHLILLQIVEPNPNN